MRSIIQHIATVSLLTAAAFGTGKQKVGNEGQVTLTSPVHLSGAVLLPGVYVFRHVSAQEHYLQVQKYELSPLPNEGYPQYILTDEAKIKCGLEGSAERNKTTELITEHRDGAMWVKEVVIEGETVVHVVQ